MATIIKNSEYVDSGDAKQTGKYLFKDDNQELTDCTVWLEKSKASEKHPDGKPWIRSAKMTEVTNRGYFSEDLFLELDKGEGVVVEVKTSAPRVLGASGVKQEVIKYLDEDVAEEYTELVNNAVAAFKEAKSANSKKTKPEDMDRAELEAYIEALRSGTSYVPAATPKSFLDMFDDVEYDRYNEILAISAENKANRPKAARAPLTDAEKASRKAKKEAKEISKAEALLAALLGGSIDAEAVEDDE